MLSGGSERNGDVTTASRRGVLFCHTVNGTPESEEQVLAACEAALRLAPADWLPDLPISNTLLGVRDWYPFEHAA